MFLTVAAWIGAIAYLLQIYYDFSAYSDMAIGMGNMLGLHYLENFNYPYISRTVTEFWRRWHMSLGTFFRDYVYIPLGGNRKGKLRTVLNRIIVFFLTGLWHGANWTFVFWGLFHGFFLLLEEYPLAERDLRAAEDGWLLETDIYNYAGACRFYVGLAGEISIVDSPEFKDYVDNYIREELLIDKTCQ